LSVKAKGAGFGSRLFYAAGSEERIDGTRLRVAELAGLCTR